MSEPRCYECGHILADINAPCPKCLPGFDEPGTVNYEAARAHRAEARVAELTARVGELGNALSRCVVEMNHARIFVTSRERIKRPEGEDLYDEVRAEAEQVLAGSPAPVRDIQEERMDAYQFGTVPAPVGEGEQEDKP